MFIAIIMLGLLAGILLLAWSRPDTIHIERSTDIHVSREKLFALINDFHNWPKWSPHDKMDVTMVRTYSGEQSGAGAVSEWKSRGQAGSGVMTITHATPPSQIVVQVDFMKPFTVRNVHTLTLQHANAPTRVTWAMDGGQPFIVKLMSLFFNMKRMFGTHFESGLDNLKKLAENG
jgi:uncharacterized protein YndB with AHSA1/START domain